jgi:FkbM family methyltransferase
MSASSLETFIRRTANRCGIDITRYRPAASESGRLATMLRHQGVNLVIDVGANIGQFASSLRRAGYSERMLSFEPLAEAYGQLVSASRNDAKWDIAPRMAVGEAEGEVEIHVSGNSVSSSILGMLESHSRSAPESRFVSKERVRIATLDSVLHDELGSTVIPFLKIDTQGYEEAVLNGAPEVLSKVRGVQLELSFVPLYEGQQIFEPLTRRLLSLGFSIWAIWPGFCDPESGRMLQIDAVFFRE